MLSRLFTRVLGRRGDDRGASMIAALTATMVVLGFGALALQLVQDDLRQADARLGREEPALHAEYAASEAVSRVIDGQESSASVTGTVDGADYDYTVTAHGGDRWTIVGRAGTGTGEHTATVELRRTVSGTGAVSVPSAERYAVYAYELIDVGRITAGDVAGPVGSGDRIKFWYADTIGTRQDYQSSCINCPNPQINTSYVPIALPAKVFAQPCPDDGSYNITGPLILGGHYDCSAAASTLRISGTIDISSPVVIHLGDDTRFDIRNATLNEGGDSKDFVIAKPTSSSWAYEAVVDNTVMYGRLLAPENYVYIGDVTWRGTFEVGTWWLYDDASIDGAWDGDGDSGGSTTTAWFIDSWQLD